MHSTPNEQIALKQTQIVNKVQEFSVGAYIDRNHGH